jgi:hypothetical protein
MARGWRTGVGIAIAFAALAVGAAWGPVAEGQRGLRIGRPAPEITGGPWLNSEPLSLAALRGRVVFVEFWTYG